jgi:hypothetical protein
MMRPAIGVGHAGKLSLEKSVAEAGLIKYGPWKLVTVTPSELTRSWGNRSEILVMSSNQVTVTLGPEYDAATRTALRSVLLELAASDGTTNWAVAGSQEIESTEVSVGGRKLLVESETYMGLNIIGDQDLVDTVLQRVLERLSKPG